MKAAALMTLGALCLLTTVAGAQDPPKTFVEARGNVIPVPLPPGGPPPRMTDGHVDFSGVWFGGPTGKANAWSVVAEAPTTATRQDPIPFRPEVAAKLKAMTRAELELGRAQVTCQPLGVPGMFTDNPYPHQIVMKPNLFIHLIESNNNWRVVRIPRQHKPKEEQETLYMGDTASRWEGDTLVLETISLDQRAWIQGNGWYKTEETKIIERLRRPSLNYLEYQYTVEDPLVLTKPWTSSWRTYSFSGSANNEDLTENFCTNNENVEQLLKLNEIESKGR
jgi:hypothetical protein